MTWFRIKTPALVLCALLVAVPAGIAGAAPQEKENKGQAKRAALSKDRPGKRLGAKGGIDPASFPVVDSDFMVMANWTRYQLGIPQAHQKSTGAGVLVAVLDGGFNLEHPEIAPRVFPFGFDAIDGDYDAHDPGNGWDDDGDGITDRAAGHGTFVAGMILEAAPDAWILPIRVRDDEGWGTNAELRRGLEFARMVGAHVVNLSVSSSWEDPADIRDLIQQMSNEGTAVVVSAGNEGLPFVDGLGTGPGSLTVAAVDWADRLAAFSNYSWSPEDNVVAAPGVDLYGPMSYYGWFVDGYWSGTSFAAGFVSGALALARARRPGRPTRQLYRDVLQTTDPVWGQGGEPMPFGRINLARVMERQP